MLCVLKAPGMGRCWRSCSKAGETMPQNWLLTKRLLQFSDNMRGGRRVLLWSVLSLKFNESGPRV